ncbi:hypothetical protein H1R20_g915, partial [Candolleomyces eurysporus]
MPEQLSSQKNYSCPFQKAREMPGAPTFAIYIDRSYAVYNNYHNSQNQTVTEVINSNNVSSTVNAGPKLQPQRRHQMDVPQHYPPTSVQNSPQSSSTGNENQGHSFHASASPGPSRSQHRWHDAGSYFPSPGFPPPEFESTDASPIGRGTSQPYREPPTSFDLGRDSINRYHPASRGLSQYVPAANGILANLPFLIQWVVTWFRTSTTASYNRSSPSDGVV